MGLTIRLQVSSSVQTGNRRRSSQIIILSIRFYIVNYLTNDNNIGNYIIIYLSLDESSTLSTISSITLFSITNTNLSTLKNTLFSTFAASFSLHFFNIPLIDAPLSPLLLSSKDIKLSCIVRIDLNIELSLEVLDIIAIYIIIYFI